MFPTEVFLAIHSRADIDTRRTLENALHWDTITYKLSPPSVDYAKQRQRCVELDLEFMEEDIFIYIIPVAVNIAYEIEVFFGSPWIKTMDGWRIDEDLWYNGPHPTWDHPSPPYVNSFLDKAEKVYLKVRNAFGVDYFLLSQTYQGYYTNANQERCIDEKRIIRERPRGCCYNDARDEQVSLYCTYVSAESCLPVTTIKMSFPDSHSNRLED